MSFHLNTLFTHKTPAPTAEGQNLHASVESIGNEFKPDQPVLPEAAEQAAGMAIEKTTEIPEAVKQPDQSEIQELPTPQDTPQSPEQTQ